MRVTLDIDKVQLDELVCESKQSIIHAIWKKTRREKNTSCQTTQFNATSNFNAACPSKYKTKAKWHSKVSKSLRRTSDESDTGHRYGANFLFFNTTNKKWIIQMDLYQQKPNNRGGFLPFVLGSDPKNLRLKFRSSPRHTPKIHEFPPSFHPPPHPPPFSAAKFSQNHDYSS